jgi:hypothetical protein
MSLVLLPHLPLTADWSTFKKTIGPTPWTSWILSKGCLGAHIVTEEPYTLPQVRTQGEASHPDRVKVRGVFKRQLSVQIRASKKSSWSK